MRVLLFVFLFLSLSSIIDRFVVADESSSSSAVSGRCPDGSDFVNCFASPCLNHQCKKGRDFCVDDYCGGCNAKCQCDTDSDCNDGESCQSGFCKAAATTAAPSNNCPSAVPTAECICLRKQKYWAVGGFHDGCTDCECKENGLVVCLAKVCPIIPTDEPTDAPTSSVKPATTNTTQINTCVITREEDFSTCQGGITPCSTVRCGTGPCVAHRCGTNGQCAAVCSCESDSNCFNGGRCVANEFGIKVCKEIPTNSTPINTCVLRNDFSSCENQMNPCAVTLCAAGTVCVPHKCENNQCSAVCSCGNDSDCGAGSVCAANDFGIKVCKEKPVTVNPSTPAPSTTSCNPSGRVCPAILCTTRECKHRCAINYCGCTDYCSCRNNTDCQDGEQCEGATKLKEGKCTVAPVTPAPATCAYNGRTYKVGTSFPSSDGCNTCFCGENGSVGCTKKACICPPEIGFATCKQAPCDTSKNVCRTRSGATCINNYCGGCNTKCQCESNDQCYNDEVCRAEDSGFSYCVKRTTTTPRPTTRTTTTTIRPTRTTTRRPTTTTRRPTTRRTTTTTNAPSNSTCILRNDFSSCENQMNPCAVTLCLAGTKCVAHKCENNQCSAVCSCSKNSDCSTGLICAANDFGIKVCKEDPSKTCPNDQREVQCTISPCSVASPQCKKGRDFCVDDYCGGCNAKCSCENNADCYSGETCQLDWKGKKFCAPAPSTPAPSTTPCNPAGRVCPAILCTNRDCKHRCAVNYCGCTDYCSCRNNNDCSNGEQCVGATLFKEGKCTLPSI